MTAHDVSPAQHVFKLLVTGPSAAGKTSLISAVSQTPVVDTDTATSGSDAGSQVGGRQRTTVAMDFGTFSIEGGGVQLLLFGTPGHDRFGFMDQILTGAVDAVVYVVDAEAVGTHAAAGAAMRQLLRDLRAPLVVAVNRCDDQRDAELVARRLGALAREAVVPCQLVDPASSREVVIETLLAVSDGMERGMVDSREPIERILALAAA